ncbi:hypothetical protein BS50DRAFT_43303 [Corynespora cassiicola Philippines]|uniref:Transcription factor BYE1 n=1 Tax=Corynespora cassiicola Philippines TaxID=1448308 RepID=A0A2T2PD28_CORCC|nr:hypothetical protein BS50DRAFT_43303 [Corynespora cassiicola Philippines]
MAVRRSGRANKGHHTKNQDLDEPPMPKPKPKPKGDKKAAAPAQSTREQSVASAEPEGEGDAIIRCVCGDQRDIRGRQMICCDKCEVWQHNKCLNLPEGDFWDEKSYYCERCKPEDHVELLAAMERGEKPWARKKGSKNKSRPSNVKSEPGSEKAGPATLQPAQTPTPAPTAPPASTQAPPAGSASTPGPTPTPTPQEAPQSGSNGHTEPKVQPLSLRSARVANRTSQTKREPPKSQPQSPAGEKRRHESTSEKDTTNKKRRKSSSQHHDKAPSQAAGPATDIEALPQKQRALAERIRDTLAQGINAASDNRGYRIPDGETPKSIASRLTLQIEHAAIEHHGEPIGGDSAYSQHMRSIMFNLKKNVALVDRLLSGSLTPTEFATMSPEEMASEEKQREYAAMREAAEKQMVLTEETGPRLRKTHKGEELVGADDMAASHEFRPPERRDRDEVPDEKPAEGQSPRHDGNTVELPEDLGRQAPLSVDTSAPQADGGRRPSEKFDIQSVFDKVRSPQNDQQTFIRRRQSSTRGPEKQQGPGDDADIDRLLKDDDGDVEMSGYSGDSSIVWKGQISMQSMEPFEAVARHVAGGDFGQVVPWVQLLNPTLPIQGRIESQKGNEYIQGLASSGSHDVSVLAVSPQNSEARVVMDHLYNYFHPRDRWGVVPVTGGNDVMRDLYVIPIEPGAGNLPPFLDMLEYCTIETPRKEHMIVLALIAKLPETKPALPATQPERFAQDIASTQIAPPAPPMSGMANGPSPSPVTNPHAPAYSPVNAAFSPAQGYGNPYAQPPGSNGHIPQMPVPEPPPHHRVPRAIEIFGPFIDEPVIRDLLSNSPTMPPVLMENLKHIVENYPETRNDTSALYRHLEEKNAANGQKHG